MKHFLLSALVGFGVATLAVLVLSVRYVRREMVPVVEAEKPTLILFATRDLPVHSTIADSDLREATIAAEFVEGWAIPATDRKALLGRQIEQPLQKGQPLGWTAFAKKVSPSVIDACASAISTAGTEEGTRAAEPVIARYRPLPDVNPAMAHAPAAPQHGTRVSVVVAALDLPDGTVLDSSHLARRQVPAELVTDSFVREEDADHLIGTRLTVNLQSGDPVLFQFLEDPAAPTTPWDCVREASATAETAQFAASRRAAQTYFEQHPEIR